MEVVDILTPPLSIYCLPNTLQKLSSVQRSIFSAVNLLSSQSSQQSIFSTINPLSSQSSPKSILSTVDLFSSQSSQQSISSKVDLLNSRSPQQSISSAGNLHPHRPRSVQPNTMRSILLAALAAFPQLAFSNPTLQENPHLSIHANSTTESHPQQRSKTCRSESPTTISIRYITYGALLRDKKPCVQRNVHICVTVRLKRNEVEALRRVESIDARSGDGAGCYGFLAFIVDVWPNRCISAQHELHNNSNEPDSRAAATSMLIFTRF
ncbi:uncharacterized protein MYCFIDRAFT_172827 [Pseudocercospora fijiensis CIRAD86]|uniref:Uncharacterized protein n=1 Tax=Pseudocercospora fijiensis (strain CIRAD86) TaxID=383855 RepID=M3B316_PSEFD|nr:uncharacterized protein MYCFIDRAFT_172827 [Pseudocercospora fijiensis CIRAD86]EME83752.1 hypothetical protein MYCFIDRAFT_172827 [Pseudocercospora fijiensis CIRAD86]